MVGGCWVLQSPVEGLNRLHETNSDGREFQPVMVRRKNEYLKTSVRTGSDTNLVSLEALVCRDETERWSTEKKPKDYCQSEAANWYRPLVPTTAPTPLTKIVTTGIIPKMAFVDTIWYDSVYLTCSKKLTGSQLSLPHRINKKLKCETKNKMMSVIGPVQSRYHEAV